MKHMLLALTLSLVASPAYSSCFGTHSFSNCNDDSGNTYTVRRYGNSTDMNGYNFNTGSSWSQNSRSIGNSTYTNGYDSDGNSWNMQQRTIGNRTYYSGTDSGGNFFSGSCGTFGCN